MQRVFKERHSRIKLITQGNLMDCPVKLTNMKAINQLTNTDKAKLLHELFPDEIPALLEDIQAVCAHFKAIKTPMQRHEALG